MEAGQQVRLKTDPDREGVLTGQRQQLGPVERLQVQFPDRKDYYPADMLELVESGPDLDNPIELIRARRFKGVDQLRGALTYGRLSGKLANLIYSMGTTNTEFYAYQFKPVLNFLESPNRSLLIADEVGLGKTIEAGLVWTELRAREQANKLLVVCPAMLREKWKDELALRFGVEAEDYSAEELLKLLSSVEEGRKGKFAAVVSLQGLRPPRKWENPDPGERAAAKLARYFDEKAHETALFDMVVVDEAHYLRNPESQTAKLGRLLRPVTDAMVLLSATPLQMRSDDLYELLRLLDDYSFSNPQTFRQILEANQPLVELRQRVLRGAVHPEDFVAEVSRIRSHPILQGSRQLEELIDKPPTTDTFTNPDARARLADYLDGINLLSRVVSRTRKRDVHEWRVVREPHALRAEMTPLQREFYSRVTQEIREYCQDVGVAEGFMLTIPQRQMTSSMPAALRGWAKKLALREEEIWESGLTSELDITDQAEVGPLTEKLSEIAADLGLTWESLAEDDAKFSELIKALTQYWRQHPEQKIVLFSFYRETLAYLKERFDKAGVDAIKLVGGTGRDERQRILAEFESPGGPQILLSSEVASEGVDLQFASAMVNYDLPWNPARLEQRIGRIDRIGQKSDKILIWNLFYRDTVDDRVFSRLLERLELFERSLGEAEAVVGPQIAQLSFDLFSHKMTPEQEEERIKQTEQALATIAQQNEDLENSAGYLMAHGDYILNQVNAAKDLRRFITGKDIYTYCREHLDKVYPGCKFIAEDEVSRTYRVRLSDKARIQLRRYTEEHPTDEETRLARSISDEVICRFDNQVNKVQGMEVISQYHPLTRFVTWSMQQSGAHYYPLVASEVDGATIKGVDAGRYLFLVVRWSVAGAKTQEILIIKALDVISGEMIDEERAERMVGAAAMEGRNIVGVENVSGEDKLSELLGRLIYQAEEGYKSWIHRMKAQNSDFVAQQRRSFNAHIDGQIQAIEERNRILRAEGRTRVIPANEGRIRKLQGIRLDRNQDLDRREKVAFDRNELVYGMVDVR